MVVLAWCWRAGWTATVLDIKAKREHAVDDFPCPLKLVNTDGAAKQRTAEQKSGRYGSMGYIGYVHLWTSKRVYNTRIISRFLLRFLLVP